MTTTTAHTTSSSPPLVFTPPPSPDPGDPNYVPGAWFDEVAVDRVVSALAGVKHTKGRWAGRPFVPEEWQLEWIIKPVFGWKHPDGTRIIRTVYIEIPRKNGKSTLASGFVIVLLVADGEMGAEVYSAATTKPQAAIVGEEVKKMVRSARQLRNKLELLRDLIRVPRTGSIFRVLSKVAEAAHGLNVHGGVIDELHIHKKRDLVDAIETGTGFRDQPLIIFITTADEGDEYTIYAEKHNRTRRIASGIIKDPTFYGVIWAAEDDDDPFSEETWKKANPGYGVTLRPEYVFKEAERARTEPSYFPVFLRLQLNRRQKSEKKWFDVEDWKAGETNGTLLTPDALRNDLCWAGLDLSSSIDLTAFGMVFPRNDWLDLLLRFWMPSDRVEERSERDGVPYDQWIEAGWITPTEGNVVDYEQVRNDINSDGGRYQIQSISIDRWNATNIATNLAADGFEIALVGQGFASLSAPSKVLERAVVAQRVRYGLNPVMTWMADEVEVVTDKADNIKPVKPDRRKSTKRIDGIHAVLNGIYGWLHAPEEEEESGTLEFLR
jgi:phage terminase large subunit-like protein